MKISQFKKLIKDSAKEAVVEVLNEMLTQNPAPKMMNETFTNFHATTQNIPPVDLGMIRAKMGQIFTEQYSSPSIQQQFIPQAPVPQPIVAPTVIAPTNLQSLFGKVASNMTMEELKGLRTVIVEN